MNTKPANGLIQGDDNRKRCWWPGQDPLYTKYHDGEWGRPVLDDQRLFEKICLEGFQSGLSWLTILRKRENFRRAFRDFDFHRVARFTTKSVDRLLDNEGIIRHRGKIEATINNARKAIELENEIGSLAAYFWSFEPAATDRPKKMTYASLSKIAQTPHSQALSKDLKKRGWKFVGPTTMYAFMQAMGLVNDHLQGCFCRDEALQLRAKRDRRIQTLKRQADKVLGR